MRIKTDPKLVDLEVDRWVAETPRAFIVVINGKRVMLPKQFCEFDENDAVMTMPEWLAIDRELV